METPSPRSIPIVLGQEDDGRWWADIESMPGVMAYGPTREAAVADVRALALRVAADCAASITGRTSRRSSKRFSSSHEPLAIREGETGFSRTYPNRMDHRMAKRIPSPAPTAGLAQLHIRLS
jgi:hypothetical protein